MSKSSSLASAAKMMPASSALTTLISNSNANADPASALTIQVLHNLQHQHLWTFLQVHYPQNERDSIPQKQQQNEAVSPISPPVSLISGIPPHRLYTHPDEQLYLLQIGLREEDLPAERIWVLPTTQGQSWSLHKLAAVFDALPSPGSPGHNNNPEQLDPNSKSSGADKEKLAKYFEKRQKANEKNEWGGKRLLFAMVDRLVGGDGTIVYYIVHDGHVKPRQN